MIFATSATSSGGSASAGASASATGSATAPGLTLEQALDSYERGDLRRAERQFRELSQRGLPLGVGIVLSGPLRRLALLNRSVSGDH